MMVLVGLLCFAAVVQHVARKAKAARPDSTVANTANTVSTRVGWLVAASLGVIVLVLMIASAQ